LRWPEGGGLGAYCTGELSDIVLRMSCIGVLRNGCVLTQYYYYYFIWFHGLTYTGQVVVLVLGASATPESVGVCGAICVALRYVRCVALRSFDCVTRACDCS
jgi:hypothetical protein